MHAAPDLLPWQWALLGLGAFLIGFSKTGIAGIGALSIAIFANIISAKASTGAILPLLVAADIAAVLSYRRHARWLHLVRLLTWAVPGIFIGYFSMKHINDIQTQRLIGAILLVVVTMHIWRQRKIRRDGERVDEQVPHTLWFAATMGLLAGFTTMVANAAGPIVVLYLLAMRLPKMEFLGTCAWYFFLLNTFKIPFSHSLGLIHFDSLRLDLALLPFVLLGALGGRIIIPYVNQRLFEWLAIFFTVISAIRLLV